MSEESKIADSGGLFARHPRTMALAASVIIAAAGIVAYSNSLYGPFIFDDLDAIQRNKEIFRVRPSLWAILFHSGSSVEGRPVVTLTFAMNYALFADDVTGYHLTNIAIHILAGLVLFGIVRRTLLLPSLGGRFSEGWAWLAGLLVGLIWTVHPLCTAAVTYVVQRCESLMGLFYFLTLYCIIVSATTRWMVLRVTWGILAVLACVLGVGCKEVMVTAPIVVFAYDRIFLAGSFRELFRRRWPVYAGLAGTWILLAFLMYAVGLHGGASSFARGTTMSEYALTQFGVIVHYLRLSFWPSPLCLDYGWLNAHGFWQIGPQSALVVGLLGLTIFGLFKFPKWAFCGVWFFCILSVTSSFIPLSENIFEHRMYLPLAAVVSLVVIGGFAAISKFAARPGASPQLPQTLLTVWTILCLACAAILAVATWQRNADYRTELSIWYDTVRKRPMNYRAWTNLSLVYMERKNPQDALDAADRAVGIKQDFAGSLIARGVIYDELKRTDEALADFDAALKLEPKNYKALLGRGKIFLFKGQYAAALADLDKIIQMRPAVCPAYQYRAAVYYKLGRYKDALADINMQIVLRNDGSEVRLMRADCLMHLGELKEALKDCDRAVKWLPSVPALQLRGLVRMRMGQHRQAADDFMAAAKFDRNNPTTYLYLSNALDAMDKTNQAISALQQAIAIAPNFPEAHFNMGNLYHKARDFEKAVAEYTSAIKLRADYADAYNNRAASLHELGRDKEAMEDMQTCRKYGSKPDEKLEAMIESALKSGQKPSSRPAGG